MPITINTQMTHVEKQLFYYVSKGKTDKAIATLLNISPDTVSKKLFGLRQKTGCNTRAELVAFAYENKILLTNNTY